MAKIDTKLILNSIFSAAAFYKSNLVGKHFLFIFDSDTTNHIEVIFKRKNFKHLTGAGSPLSAERFYQKALDRTLTINQLEFNHQHPADLCIRKLGHFSNIQNILYGNCFILENITTHTRKYTFGTTDLNITLCTDNVAHSPARQYIPISLRDEDCFSKCQSAYIVNYILCKKTDEKYYNQILYPANCYTVSTEILLADVISMLDPTLIK